MTSETQTRAVDQIHIGDGKFIGRRAIHMEWFGDETEDELDTLARLRFTVTGPEYAKLAKLGLVDSEASDGEAAGEMRLTLRTDLDLVDDAEETLAEEWHSSLEDASAELTIWNDLDYWEVESID